MVPPTTRSDIVGMDKSALLLWLLVLFICSSLQTGTFTIECLPLATLTASPVVIVTIHSYQANQTQISTASVSSPTHSSTKTATISGSHQNSLPSAGSSDSSDYDNDDDPPPRRQPSQRWSPRVIADLPPLNIGPPGEDDETLDAGPSSRTHSGDQSRPRDRVVHPTNISDHWTKYLRKTKESPLKRQLWEDRDINPKRKQRLWTPDHDIPPRTPRSRIVPNIGLSALAAGALYRATVGSKRKGQHDTHTPPKSPETSQDEAYDIVLQPETQPISEEQLITEVKEIYAGLVMVEAKCIEVDKKQTDISASDNAASLSNEQWQALMVLHRTLLHEHHDFFLASQHPLASPALRRLAAKYAMPARMWRLGIHSFLELMRARLPESVDFMKAFIYLAYSLMALLYETVPAFQDTWIECLGDLARYRMAIEDEDEDERDREIWRGVARDWYSRKAHHAPDTGRLYHHLAILARHDYLKQLFYYSKSLSTGIPFESSRQSILTLFESIPANILDDGNTSLESALVQVHERIFRRVKLEGIDRPYESFIGALNARIAHSTREFMEIGCHIALANNFAMLNYGSARNVLIRALNSSPGQNEDFENSDVEDDYLNDYHSEDDYFRSARILSYATLTCALQKPNDANILPMIHVALAFIYCISRFDSAKESLEVDFPWLYLANFLNSMLESVDVFKISDTDSFPRYPDHLPQTLNEDYAVRGSIWSEGYYPDDMFSSEFDPDTCPEYTVAATEERRKRILWLGTRIAENFPLSLKYQPATDDSLDTAYDRPQFFCNLPVSFTSVTDYSSQPLPELDMMSFDMINATSEKSTWWDSTSEESLLDILEPMWPLQLYPSEESMEAICPENTEDSEVLPMGEPATVKASLTSMDSMSINPRARELSALPHLHIVQDNSVGARKTSEFEMTEFPTDLVVLNHARDNSDDDQYRAKRLKACHPSEDDGNEDENEDEDVAQELDHISTTAEIYEQRPPTIHTNDCYNTKYTSIAANTALPKAETKSHTPTPTERFQKISPKPMSEISSLLDPSLQVRSPGPSLDINLSPSFNDSSSQPTKSHNCSYCNKAFARKSDMNKHINSHTKPITCQTCQSQGSYYGCARAADLKRHQHAVHKDIFGEEEFPCPYAECQRQELKYTRSDNLVRHLKRKHSDGPEHDGTKKP